MAMPDLIPSAKTPSAMRIASNLCENFLTEMCDCRCNRGFELAEDGRSCERDPSFCSPACENGGSCENGRCRCSPAWRGHRCSLDVNECRDPQLHNCEQDCENTHGGFR